MRQACWKLISVVAGQRTDKGAWTLETGENGSAMQHNKKVGQADTLTGETWYRMEPLLNPLDLFHIPIWEGAHLEKKYFHWHDSLKYEFDRLGKCFTLSALPVTKTSWPKTCLESVENLIFLRKKIHSWYVLLQMLKSYVIKTAVLKPPP